jgi:hypothetical protein
LKFYINPEIYKIEKDCERKEIEEVKFEKENPNKAKNLFDDISLRSAQTGEFQMPKELRDILNYQKQQQAQEQPPVEDDEDTLG